MNTQFFSETHPSPYKKCWRRQLDGLCGGRSRKPVSNQSAERGSGSGGAKGWGAFGSWGNGAGNGDTPDPIEE